MGVDVEHAVHARGHDHDGISERRRTTREAGTAATSYERTAVATRDADRSRDLIGGAGPADGDGLALAHPRIAPVQRELEGLGTRTGRTERIAEVSQ